ncbi:lysoplasmalogenase family protein [Clostridium sp. CS001]|uniref:lysoplasmalogenase family protein n=1 Tax=Clostridium sp. CS001 TaxID=2880648 RepID=UPI001CF17B7E|nr:lysoplasmalogenase family protein [Clostridium sp. CS001]MCB2291132.1 lysoplasmalogenase family protein [Clostridium sp. CS001]
MKDKNFNGLIIRVITLIILILYVLFLYMDLYDVKTVITSEYIKYMSIILCFILSILPIKKLLGGRDIVNNSYTHIANYRDRLLLQFGMFITVIADLCLVIFDFYILGVVFFSMVQIIYSVRYDPKKQKVTLINFFIAFQFIVLSYFTVRLFIREISILLPISLFYSICLLTSVIKAIKAFKSNLYPLPNKYMVVLGMILFLLCDICVALSNVTTILPIEAHFIISLQQIASFLIWVFYLPSQLLLSLSGSNNI